MGGGGRSRGAQPLPRGLRASRLESRRFPLCLATQVPTKVADAVQAKAEQLRDDASAAVQQKVDDAKAAPGNALVDAKAAVDEQQNIAKAKVDPHGQTS